MGLGRTESRRRRESRAATRSRVLRPRALNTLCSPTLHCRYVYSADSLAYIHAHRDSASSPRIGLRGEEATGSTRAAAGNQSVTRHCEQLRQKSSCWYDIAAAQAVGQPELLGLAYHARRSALHHPAALSSDSRTSSHLLHLPSLLFECFLTLDGFAIPLQLLDDPSTESRCAELHPFVTSPLCWQASCVAGIE